MYCYCWRAVCEKVCSYFEYNRNMGDWIIICMGLKDVPVYFLSFFLPKLFIFQAGYFFLYLVLVHGLNS